jgi:hypothetical protein
MIRLMIRTVLSLTVVALGGTSILFAGQTGRQFSLSGSVVNAVTAAPVPYASVALSNGSSTETDATGAFQFSGLEANVYGVMATKAGFVPAGLPGKEVPEDGLEISLTASVANIVVKLIPLGAIRGRVVDGAGEPVQNATVTALRSTVVYGRRQLQMVNFVQTNDLGDYRISGLLAGKYLLQAAGTTSHNAYYGEKPPAEGATDAFAPTYFGGAHRADAAELVSLSPGQEARADIAVELETEHVIRGRIANYRPNIRATLLLSNGDGDRGLASVALEYATGRFEVHGVRDGVYRLLAYQNNGGQQLVFDQCTIEVTGHDVADVVLSLASAASVIGTVQVDDSTGNRSPRFQMHLVPQDVVFSEITGPVWSNPAKNGSFEIASVPPGKYWVDFESGDGYYVASARAGDTDLLATQEIAIGEGGRPPIEIVLRTDSGTVRGKIDSPAAAKTDAIALLVPESCSRPTIVGYVASGVFGFADVAPGAYRVYAWRQGVELEYGLPNALCALAHGGVRVEVEAGREATVRLLALSEEPK